MQQGLFVDYADYSGHKVLLGLSGGINSMAALCWLAQAPAHLKPAELHLLYHHFDEHSPDTMEFVVAGLCYATRHFDNVTFEVTNNSVNAFFEKSKMIPHPSISPCTRYLKQIPTFAYMARHGITHNVVGYIQGEAKRRAGAMAKRTKTPITEVVDKGVKIDFTVSQFDDAWCFAIVGREIGWHPAIYDIKDAKGRRVFKHNNCLPCKNMKPGQLATVAEHFPALMARARETETAVGRHWGGDENGYYSRFGRHERDPAAGEPCAVCAFD